MHFFLSGIDLVLSSLCSLITLVSGLKECISFWGWIYLLRIGFFDPMWNRRGKEVWRVFNKEEEWSWSPGSVVKRKYKCMSVKVILLSDWFGSEASAMFHTFVRRVSRKAVFLITSDQLAAFSGEIPPHLYCYHNSWMGQDTIKECDIFLHCLTKQPINMVIITDIASRYHGCWHIKRIKQLDQTMIALRIKAQTNNLQKHSPVWTFSHGSKSTSVLDLLKWRDAFVSKRVTPSIQRRPNHE